MRKLGWVSGSYYTLLTVSLICSQCRLAKALKELIGQESAIYKDIKSLFFILCFGYTARTIFFYGQGSYSEFVNSQLVRIELEYVLLAVFDSLILLPILLMHQKNFSNREQSDCDANNDAPLSP